MSTDSETVVRIGSFHPFTHSKSSQSFTLKVPDGKGGVNILMPDWSIVNANIVKDPKTYNAIEPMRIKLHRGNPVLRLQKGILPDSAVNEVLKLLRESQIICDRNNSNEYDKILEEPVGKMANAQYWFEDLRETKAANVNLKKETHEIGQVIVSKMSGNETALRDALFLIGESPTASMGATDLEDLLWEKATEEGSESRKVFLDVFVNSNVNAKTVDAMKYFKKGVALGIITNKSGVYMLGSDRLGMDENECVAYLKDREGVYSFLVNQIASKSSFEEDGKRGDDLKEKVTGKSAEKDANEQMRKFAYSLCKESFGWKRPDLKFKEGTLEEIIEEYAKECVSLKIENIIPTVEALAELSAKATVS